LEAVRAEILRLQDLLMSALNPALFIVPQRAAVNRSGILGVVPRRGTPDDLGSKRCLVVVIAAGLGHVGSAAMAAEHQARDRPQPVSRAERKAAAEAFVSQARPRWLSGGQRKAPEAMRRERT
jgi:hypothetical protein